MSFRFYLIQSCLLAVVNMSQDFYLRYYVGHKGKFGHEFLEFEYRPDGMFACCLPLCLLAIIFVVL